MDRKGTEEEITYPNIFFTIDNFEEVSFWHSLNEPVVYFLLFAVAYELYVFLQTIYLYAASLLSLL